MILVTGGAGYIGSHTCLALIAKGHDIIVIDNLSNSSYESIRRVENLTNKKIKFIKSDIKERHCLDEVFNNYSIEAVIHFAALKSVSESVEKPLVYYDNNITGTLTLLAAMQSANVNNLIFSSSATVYGSSSIVPNKENDTIGGTTNPYGTSKYFSEIILQDFCKSNELFSAVSLRYFNPTGAHKSGMIGEDPNGIPNNLIPYISQVATGKLKYLNVYGGDYDTIDGTGMRDYIHVDDLAEGHVKTLEYMLSTKVGYDVFNLGSGRAYSVLQIIKAFERVTKKEIPYNIVARRNGDLDKSWADTEKARNLLGWEAKYGIEDMLQDVWNWQSHNPNGYRV
ncbi:UDP-glucose 4-epimerase [Salmonella enterica]|nr:UDP-glucose 4-epimerase [Salmonella enterica]GAS40900.1 UDP-glucose 4-epimerase [Salmonella enterica]